MWMCRSLSPRGQEQETSYLLLFFFAFPHPYFFAFAYPSKPLRCQNTRILLELMLLLHLTEPELQMPISWWGGKREERKRKRKAPWVCFTQPFPEGKAQGEYIDENAGNTPWGLGTGSNRGAAVPAFIYAGGSRLSKTFPVVFDTLRAH